MHSILFPRMKDKSLIENFAAALETSLPGPPDVRKNYQQVECGICYAQFLPIGMLCAHALKSSNLHIFYQLFTLWC